MKKILTLILSVILLLGCFTGVSASSVTADITDTEEALALLSYMNMIDPAADVSGNITRAEFASLVAKVIKAAPTSGKQYYVDVEATFHAFDAVSALTELGYLSVNADMKFRPNDNIMLSEAAKILVSMLGYGEVANAKGGFPAGYLEVAKRLDITEGISAQYITKEQAYVMLMRAMNVPMYTVNGVSDGSVYYEVDNASTILSVYHDIYYIEDTVNAAGPVSLVDSANISEGEVLIGNKTLRTDSISQDMYEYLGMTIIGYYTEADSKKASLVVALPLGEENSVITVSKEDVTTIEDKGGYYSFEYYDEKDRAKTVKVPRGAVVVKNGTSVTKDLFSEMSITKGSYKFLDHDNDNKIDVLFVNEYYNLIVGLIDNAEGMVYIKTEGNLEYYRGQVGSRRVIYDKFDQNLSLDVTEDFDKIIKFKNADGSLCTIEDIALNEVLSIYKSSDGNYIEIVKGSAAVSGTVETVSYPDSNTVTFSIGETKYDMDASVLKLVPEKLEIGFSGTFYLDAFGRIGYYTVDADADVIYGYLTKVGGDNNGFDRTVYMEIFSQNNVLDTYTLHEKAVVDGSNIKGELDNAYELLSPHAKQMIRFKANADKKVTFVDTLSGDDSKEGKKHIRETTPFAKYTFSGATGSFSQTMVTQVSTPVLVVPTDATIDSGNYDEHSFAIYKRSNMRADTAYNVAVYRADPDAAFEDIILNKRDSAFTNHVFVPPVMVSEIRNVVNDEGNIVTSIIGYSSKKPAKYETVDDSVLKGYNINKGDLVWFEMNLEGKIISVIDVLVDCGDELTFNVQNSTSKEQKFYSKSLSVTGGTAADLTDATMSSSFCIAYGYAGRIVDGVIRFAYTKEDCENEDYVLARNISAKDVIIFDREGGKDGNIYWGAPADIIDYKMGGDNCSAVIIQLSQNSAQRVFVYK